MYQGEVESDQIINPVYDIIPGVGNEFQILAIEILNNDTLSRVVEAFLDDGTNHLVRILKVANLPTADHLVYPQAVAQVAEEAIAAVGLGMLVSGTMRLRFQGTSFAVDQEMGISLILRVRGGIPAVDASVNVGNMTETVRTEQVF